MAGLSTDITRNKNAKILPVTGEKTRIYLF